MDKVIRIDSDGKKKIAKVFDCTERSVENALSFRMTDADKAKRMRKMARELGARPWKLASWEEMD